MTETQSPSPPLLLSFSLESEATLAFRLISYLKFVGDINGVCGGNWGQMLWALVGRGQEEGAAAGSNKLYSILFCISISSSRCLCKVCNTNHSRQATQQLQQKQYYTQFLASVLSFFCTFFCFLFLLFSYCFFCYCCCCCCFSLVP